MLALCSDFLCYQIFLKKSYDFNFKYKKANFLRQKLFDRFKKPIFRRIEIKKLKKQMNYNKINHIVCIDLLKFLFRFFMLFLVEIIKLKVGEKFNRFCFYTMFHFLFSISNSIVTKAKKNNNSISKNLLFSILLTFNIAETVSYYFMKAAINVQAIHAIDFSFITHDHIEFFLLMILIIFIVIILNVLPIYEYKIVIFDVFNIIFILFFTLFFI